MPTFLIIQNYLFFLKPRKLPLSHYHEKYVFPKNIIFIDTVNIYELIIQTDFHITIYSTCAIEAPSLGKKNILFNIDGKAKEYLGETLKNDVTTVYVDTIEEFNKVILNVDAPSLKSIFEAHKDVLYSGYTKNMDYFLENIL